MCVCVCVRSSALFSSDCSSRTIDFSMYTYVYIMCIQYSQRRREQKTTKRERYSAERCHYSFFHSICLYLSSQIGDDCFIQGFRMLCHGLFMFIYTDMHTQTGEHIAWPICFDRLSIIRRSIVCAIRKSLLIYIQY